MSLLPVVTINCPRIYSFDPTNQPGLIPRRDILPTDFQRFGSRNWPLFHRKYGTPEVLFARLPPFGTTRDAWVRDFVETSKNWPLIVLAETSAHVLQRNGARYKQDLKLFARHGYTGSLKFLPARAAGAPVTSGRFWTLYTPTDRYEPTNDTAPLGIPSAPPRGTSNCLRHVGVNHQLYVDPHLLTPPRREDGIEVVGRYHGRPVYGSGGPIYPSPTSLVVDRWGIRPLLIPEWKTIMGAPPEWRIRPKILTRLLEGPTAQEWSVLTHTVTRLLHHGSHPSPTPDLSTPGPKDPDPSPPPITSTWSWTAPDLGPASPFRKERRASLHRAARQSGEGPLCLRDGEEALLRHALNYGDNGPTALTILWWEWDPIHWEELRTGASMNFITLPSPGLVPNLPFTAEELKTATQFVDELIGLKVLVPVATPLQNNLPVFLVDKPDQPGQKRTIADGKAGGQNPVCSADPVHFPSPDDILPLLYPGGWSGSVDCSKFFHMFLTKPGERPHLGILHPATREPYWYEWLPMGTCNSPGVAGHFGVSFLQVLRRHPVFSGTESTNTFASYLGGQQHHAKWGTGRVLLGVDGLPACLVWIHVDDILVHGPTKEKTELAMTVVMNEALRLGLICQPCKMKAPAQVRKHCGFIYDTIGLPTRTLPPSKISKALAYLDYLGHLRGH